MTARGMARRPAKDDSPMPGHETRCTSAQSAGTGINAGCGSRMPTMHGAPEQHRSLARERDQDPELRTRRLPQLVLVDHRRVGSDPRGGRGRCRLDRRQSIAAYAGVDGVVLRGMRAVGHGRLSPPLRAPHVPPGCRRAMGPALLRSGDVPELRAVVERPPSSASRRHGRLR